MNKLMGTKWFTFYTKVRPVGAPSVRKVPRGGSCISV